MLDDEKLGNETGSPYTRARKLVIENCHRKLVVEFRFKFSMKATIVKCKNLVCCVSVCVLLSGSDNDPGATGAVYGQLQSLQAVRARHYFIKFQFIPFSFR